MDKKTKQEEETKENTEQFAENDEDNLANDQIKHSYYYDDACGYEIYVEEDDDDEDEQ